LPGDELIPDAIGALTHAITIRRPPHEVWPWLVQMGAGRAGWYSYDFIDNGGQSSAEEIRPQFQHVQPGTIFPALPGETEGFSLIAFHAERFLVLGWQSPDGTLIMTWTFVLEEIEQGCTRLIVRARGAPGYQCHGLPWPIAKFILVP